MTLTERGFIILEDGTFIPILTDLHIQTLKEVIANHMKNKIKLKKSDSQMDMIAKLNEQNAIVLIVCGLNQLGSYGINKEYMKSDIGLLYIPKITNELKNALITLNALIPELQELKEVEINGYKKKRLIKWKTLDITLEDLKIKKNINQTEKQLIKKITKR